LLRLFLGVTFAFAGLQKLANPKFFDATSPTSFQSQIHGALGASPIAPLLRLTLHAPVAIAVAIAIGEVLVGLGTLVGFLARPAAAAGAVLSLSFFLSISYGTSPYYYGSDIVFFFAWTVLVLGGAGPLSIDRWLARPTTNGGAVLGRRTVLSRGALATLGVVATGALAGIDAAVGHAASSTADRSKKASTAGPSQTTPSSRTKIASAASVPVGSAFAFTDPQSGQPAFVVHEPSGAFAAFSAVCTHAGCTVSFDGTNAQFVCPCHGSIYNAATGAVENGPAPAPLPSIALAVDGTAIYLKNA
jgi:thiosulfate dehydrogenase [quinone] large subunit